MNNPPAFPKTVDGTRQQQDGMDLRDYFAAAALQGIMAFSGDDISSDMSKWGMEVLAGYAYKAADAMLAEREKQLPAVSKSQLP